MVNYNEEIFNKKAHNNIIYHSDLNFKHLGSTGLSKKN